MRIIKKQDVAWGKIPRAKRTKYDEESYKWIQIEGYTYFDHFPGYGNWEWIDPFVFEATIKIEGIQRGRSAAHFSVSDEEDNVFTLHLASLFEIIKSVGIEPGGKITAVWQFRKRGSNYGVEFVSKPCLQNK